jgi:hypothetical protein
MIAVEERVVYMCMQFSALPYTHSTCDARISKIVRTRVRLPKAVRRRGRVPAVLSTIGFCLLGVHHRLLQGSHRTMGFIFLIQRVEEGRSAVQSVWVRSCGGRVKIIREFVDRRRRSFILATANII